MADRGFQWVAGAVTSSVRSASLGPSARPGPALARPGPVHLGGDLYSRRPTCEAARAAGGSFLFVRKPANRKTPSEYLHGVALDERPRDRGAGRDRVRPPLQLDDRWKVENETFNVLKTRGYNLERNFGHGRETLASAPVALDPLAFAMRTASDFIEAARHHATGTRMRLFERLRTIAAYHVFPSWRALMTTLVTGLPPPAKPDVKSTGAIGPKRRPNPQPAQTPNHDPKPMTAAIMRTAAGAGRNGLRNHSHSMVPGGLEVTS